MFDFHGVVIVGLYDFWGYWHGLRRLL